MGNNLNYRSNIWGVVIVILAMLFILPLIFAQPKDTPPPTKMYPVIDNYNGVEVTDNYRWLENFEDTVVKDWNAEENAYTRQHLDNVPARNLIKKQLTDLMTSNSTDYYSLKYVNGIIFAYKNQPPKEQPLLITLESVDDPSTERVILDLEQLDSNGTTAMDFFVPSPDGKLVAVSLSKFGSEIGDIYIYDVETGEPLVDLVPRVNGPTAGGDIAWKKDNSGFYYTHYPRKGERPDDEIQFFQQVYYHKLGTGTDEDTYCIGKDFPKIAEIEFDASDDGNNFLATVSNGDGGEFAHYLLNGNGTWTQITKFDDLIPTIKFAPDNSLYLLSHKDAPMGKILHLDYAEHDISKATTVIPESDVSIREYLPTDDYLYVIDMAGGPSDMRVFDHNGVQQKDIPVKPISSLSSLVCMGGNNIIFRSSSYTDPSAWYFFDPTDWKVRMTALYLTSPANFSDIEVVREFATSKDGTKIPINIMYRKGTELNGKNPTILYAYGGYGICMNPYFNADNRLWFDQGGVYAVANIRGGGEYGEAWHLAGNLTKKQNVFDDYAACAQYLIDRKYTSADKMVFQGGSNGGLLMGVALTQHPELCRAVVSRVGIYDMLRVELDPNGAFNVTEFGTVKNPEQFKALYAYSPYHHVKKGTAYPSVLFLTGDYDGRVNPFQSRKMTALLQASTGSGNPIFLRTSAETGHGGGTSLSRKIEYQTDVYSFIIDQLGIPFKYDK